MTYDMTVDKSLSSKNYEKALDTQRMIDCVAKQLFGLRECKKPDELIWSEICEAETKIIMLYKKLLFLRDSLNSEELPFDFPKTDQWLHIVGLNDQSIEKLIQNNILFDSILTMSDLNLREELLILNIPNVEFEILTTATKNLKISIGGSSATKSLHWSSITFYKKSPKPRHHSYASSSSSPSDHFISASSLSPQLNDFDSEGLNSSIHTEQYGYTPPSTPQFRVTKGKVPATPPPKKKNKLQVDSFQPLTKSKSHESQLSYKISTDSQRLSKKSLLSMENGEQRNDDLAYKDSYVDPSFKFSQSGHSSPLPPSPYKGGHVKTGDSLNAAAQQTVMKHTINHRFQNKLVMTTCEYCHKYVFRGRLCRYCKLIFHRDCALKAVPTCGLPEDLLKYFMEQLKIHGGESSPDFSNRQQETLTVPESSSNISSLSSSSPASPVSTFQSAYSDTQFRYPDPSEFLQTFDSSNFEASGTVISVESDRSDRTIIDTVGSSSSGDPTSFTDRVDSLDVADEDGIQLRRDNSITVALREWEIPINELILDKEIGHGQFGKVYRSNWHGEVAVKVISLDADTDNQLQLQAFKAEVTMLKKTRHDNLVLFMGACMNPPSLAIVTSFVRGSTLYYKLHEKRERFLMHQIVVIATQVAQGLGYLHAKNIVHKDLKTKNIFVESLKSGSVENFKVIITDFGILSMTRLCCLKRNNNYILNVPKGWIYYLAPEIVKLLRPHYQSDEDLPFTKQSDVYAFGTVWYELMYGEWPFYNQPLESIIWLIGNGVKHSVNSNQCSQEFKDLLMHCWAFETNNRPSCQSILKNLERLPRKRLARSPSHPVQLSRSAENLL